jgi:hypothetical protein
MNERERGEERGKKESKLGENLNCGYVEDQERKGEMEQILKRILKKEAVKYKLNETSLG